MNKLLFRFLIFALISSIFISYLLFLGYQFLENNRVDRIIKNNVLAKYDSIYEYLNQYPIKDWQMKLKAIHPPNTSQINLVRIDQLSLPPSQINQIEKRKIVYKRSFLDKIHPAVIYKKIADTPYAFQEFLDFTPEEKAQRFFGWTPALAALHLKTIPPNQWDSYLSKLTQRYQFPITLKDFNTLPKQQQLKLLKNPWSFDTPDFKNPTQELLYYRISADHVLQFGTIHYRYIDIYEKYFLFLFGILITEIFIFVLAYLFLRSLGKLSTLVNAYANSDFKSQIKLRKYSSLYPLFINLITMKDKIKNLIQNQKDLTHSIAHELRTPLSRLEFSLELINKATNKSEIEQRVESMKEDIGDLSAMIDELLSYAQLSIVQPKFQMINLDLLISQLIKKQPLTLQIIYQNHHPELLIKADPTKLSRALLNILTNAERFARSLIRIRLEKAPDSYYHLTIEDDGPGIPNQDKERIFEPFIQTHKTKTKNYGLGLAIVKKIIDSHQWEIYADDSDLGGAKFVIVLK